MKHPWYFTSQLPNQGIPTSDYTQKTIKAVLRYRYPDFSPMSFWFIRYERSGQWVFLILNYGWESLYKCYSYRSQKANTWIISQNYKYILFPWFEVIVEIRKGVYILNEIPRAQQWALPMSLTTHVTNPPLHSRVYLQPLDYFRDIKMKTIGKVDM